MQQQMASVPLPNTKTYMVAPMLTTDDAGISTEPVKMYKHLQIDWHKPIVCAMCRCGDMWKYTRGITNGELPR